jgi:hypothetical protein
MAGDTRVRILPLFLHVCVDGPRVDCQSVDGVAVGLDDPVDEPILDNLKQQQGKVGPPVELDGINFVVVDLVEAGELQVRGSRPVQLAGQRINSWEASRRACYSFF